MLCSFPLDNLPLLVYQERLHLSCEGTALLSKNEEETPFHNSSNRNVSSQAGTRLSLKMQRFPPMNDNHVMCDTDVITRLFSEFKDRFMREVISTLHAN